MVQKGQLYMYYPVHSCTRQCMDVLCHDYFPRSAEGIVNIETEDIIR